VGRDGGVTSFQSKQPAAAGFVAWFLLLPRCAVTEGCPCPCFFGISAAHYVKQFDFALQFTKQHHVKKSSVLACFKLSALLLVKSLPSHQ
jgi:hypothetical protein